MKFLSPIDVNGYISLTTQNPGVTPTKFLIQDANGRIAFRTGQELKVDIGADYTEVVRHTVKASVAINKGQAVYTIPTQNGTNILVGLASNDAESTSSKTLGLLDATVAINGVANVVTQGLLAGLNTATATIGDPVWLGTNGNLIYGLANKPYAPAHLVFIGIVTRVNLNNGEIFIRTQNGFELDELHDVDLKTTTPVNGHILGYNGTLWVNKTIASWLGFTPANDNNVVHKTGTETIDGVKTFSSAMILNSSLNIVGGGYSILYNPGTTGYWQNYVDSSNVYNFGYNGTNVKAKIDTSGNFTANSFIKSGGTASQFLKADGSVDSNSYLSSITNAMVVAALGYTPYSNTNPNNYISGITSSMVTTALGYTPISSLTDTLATVASRGNVATVSLAGRNSLLVNKSDGSAGGQLSYDSSINQLYLWNSVAAGYFSIYTNNSERLNIATGGAVTANVDMRAPIFYDSNDTSYYVNPNGDSRLSRTYIGNYTNYMTLGAWDGVNNRIEAVGQPLFLTSYGGSIKFGYQGAVQMELATNGVLSTSQYIYSSTYMQAGQSMYSPIYYDANDTAYFLDLNSTGKSAKIGGYLETYASANKAILVGNWNGANYWGMGSNGAHTIRFDMVNADSSTFQGASDVNLQLGTNTVYHTGNNYGLELYKSQTVDMSNTAVFSASNYYPVTIPLSQTEAFTIQIQNNLNSNVPSWATHGAGFSLNMKWVTNGSGWGTTEVKRKVYQYHERFANQTICGGITQMTNSSTEVVWLRGGGTYYFKFSRDLTATANSGTYTVSSQSVSPTSSAQNTVWNSAAGYENYYVNNVYASENIYSPIYYDTNNTGYYVDPASTSTLNTLFVNNYIGRNSYSNGYFVGGQNNIGATDGKTNPIYTIGTSYMPSDTALNSMYGIGFSHTNFWGGKTPSWGMYVAQAGTIIATVGDGIWTSGDVTAYSDARVKDNIEVIKDAISKIKEIRGVTFTRNDASEESKDQRKTGVIAQEVLKVLPEAVSGDEENMYSVAYGNMVGLLIEGIKEQQTQIEELKQLLNHLINK